MASKSIRLSYIMELVISFAVGLGLARYGLSLRIAEGRAFGGLNRVQNVLDLVQEFLLGFSLVQGLCLLFAVMRKVAPKVWGIGRRIWVFVCLSSLTLLTMSVVHLLVSLARRRTSYTRMLPGLELRSICLVVFPLVAVLWLTDRLSGLPRDPAPDAREWTGQVFGVVVLAWVLLRPFVW